MSFSDTDLSNLLAFLDSAPAVVPYIDVYEGKAPPGSIALRHDVDHDLRKALRFAKLESRHGFRSSYYILHSAKYYDQSADLIDMLLELQGLGHEVGIHNDALCATGNILTKALDLLSGEIKFLKSNGINITGAADHGGSPVNNGDIWNYKRPEDFGLKYEAYQLQKSTNTYISDNQGTWRSPLKHAQTFMLVHPIWWPV